MRTRISVFDSKTKGFGTPDMAFWAKVIGDVAAGQLIPLTISSTRVVLADKEGNVRLDIAEVDAENYN